ncbi:MAG: ROK family protein [Gemmatimonadetes bacterium]|nr:ROK family protein [Gemmatimonadota bacterium]
MSAPQDRPARPATLAIDIGGSGLKATVLDPNGQMLVERIRVATPRPITPPILVDALVELAKPLPEFDRVSVGFPGVVRNGVVRTAINLDPQTFPGFDLAVALESRFGKPVRVINDADMQGYGAIRGEGVELVITLGTGMGSALFCDGKLAPHLELAHHPFHKGRTYEHELGEQARRRFTRRKWNRRVKEAIEALRTLTNFDHMYIGGGNAKRLELELPADVTVVDNNAGVLGGIRLWESEK